MFITKCFFSPRGKFLPSLLSTHSHGCEGFFTVRVSLYGAGKRQGRCSLEKQSGRGGTLPRHLGKGVGQRRWRGSGVRSAWVRVGSRKNSEPLLLSCLPRCDGLCPQEQINPSPSDCFCQHFVTGTRQVTKATSGLVLQTHRLQDSQSAHRVYLLC